MYFRTYLVPTFLDSFNKKNYIVENNLIFRVWVIDAENTLFWN